MKLRAIVLTFTALLFVQGSYLTVFAADISISSGEHEDFSRLVVNFPERVAWSFGRVEGGFEFRAEATDTTYLLGEIYARIPRDRIEEVKDLGNGRIFIAVTCECHGDAFDLREGQVALDIKDGPPLPIAQLFNQYLPHIEPALNLEASADNIEIAQSNPSLTGVSNASVSQTPSDLTGASFNNMRETGQDSALPPLDMRSSLREARHGLPLFLPLEASAEAAITPARPPPPDLSAPAASLRSEDPPQNGMPAVPETQFSTTVPDPDGLMGDRLLNPKLDELEVALAEQIGRASSQGLLVPDFAQTTDQIRQATDLLETGKSQEVIENTPEPMTSDLKNEPESHISVQTSASRASQAVQDGGGTTQDGVLCLQDRYFDVAKWGGDVTNGAQLGDFRSGLVGEFDLVQSEAILALARYYIYLTFGAETVSLLNRLQPEIERVDLLLVMAEIMDFQKSERGRFLSEYLTCDGKVVLWAALAAELLEPGTDINTAALAAAFSELPVHLRRHLGPPLASKLIEAGKAQAAKSLHNAIDRAPGDHGASLSYLEAQLAMSQGRAEEVITPLDTVVASDTELAPEAIRDLIEYKIAQGIEISEHEIAVAASHAFELRGTEIGQALVLAEIRALAETASFASTFARFAWYKSRGDIQPETEGEILAHIVRNLTTKGQDAVFLRYMIGLPPESHLPSSVRYDAAARLANLGFYQDAREVLEQSDRVPNPDERRLFATIALAEEKFDVTLGYLAGLNDAEDALLRAEALTGKEEYAEAAEMYSLAGDSESSLKSSWRSGAWEKVTDFDHGIAARASRLMMTSPVSAVTPEDEILTLSYDTSLLAESEEVREVVSTLLGEFEVP